MIDVTTEISAVINLVDSYLQWSNDNQPARGHEHYHPSAFGQCLRKAQYQRYTERGLLTASKVETKPFVIRVWGNGHSMHHRWRTYFEELGILKGIWKCSNPLCSLIDNNGKLDKSTDITDVASNLKTWLYKTRAYGIGDKHGCFKPEKCICGCIKFHYEEVSVVDKELNFTGHADGILDFSQLKISKFGGILPEIVENLPKKPIVVDMKSINHFDFQEVAKGNPHLYYQIQLMIYTNILDCDFGFLLYENKNNQRTVGFKVDRQADSKWQEIKRQASLMNEMVDVVDENGFPSPLLPPPRPLQKISSDCEYCPYKGICHSSPIWDDPNLDQMRKDFYGSLLY